MSVATDSILDSIKELLGIQQDYRHYDPQLIVLINSAFATVAELGVGNEIPYKIVDESNEWSEVIGTQNYIENLKSYIYLKTKLLFDPPASSTVLEAFTKAIEEAEWRMNVAVETEAFGKQSQEGG